MGKFAGVVVVNKEKGYTSHDVVAILRRLYNEKAGHTGTLDPNATGVLPVCLGKATKFSEYFMSQNKSYTAEVLLGVVTTTGDVTGDVLLDAINASKRIYGENPAVRELNKCKKFNVAKQEVEKVLESFKGTYKQTPPMYSAIKIGGQKLYELARDGQTIERKPRLVEIFDIKMHEFNGSSFTINVDCSKGTYIRSLCVDIGIKLGVGATMGNLIRTRSGKFCMDGALTIDEIKNTADAWGLVTPIEELLPYPFAELKPHASKSAKNGNHVRLVDLDFINVTSSKHWLRANGGIIGLFSLKNEHLVCEVML